jgi:hypothetical protein
MSLARIFFSIIITTALIGASMMTSGCYDDECADGCLPGYACYYGVCLSRGWCSANDPNADTCAEYDSNGECTLRVDHGICDRGYVCVCRVVDEDGECEPSSRQCMETTDIDE